MTTFDPDPVEGRLPGKWHARWRQDCPSTTRPRRPGRGRVKPSQTTRDSGQYVLLRNARSTLD
jgi:hypothetical protein